MAISSKIYFLFIRPILQYGDVHMYMLFVHIDSYNVQPTQCLYKKRDNSTKRKNR